MLSLVYQKILIVEKTLTFFCQNAFCFSASDGAFYVIFIFCYWLRRNTVRVARG